MKQLMKLLRISQVRQLGGEYWRFSKDDFLFTISSMLRYSHKKRALEKLHRLFQTHERAFVTQATTRLQCSTQVGVARNPKALLFSLHDIVSRNQLVSSMKSLRYITKFVWMRTEAPLELKLNIFETWRIWATRRRALKALLFHPLQKPLLKLFSSSLVNRKLTMGIDRLNQTLKVAAGRLMLSQLVKVSQSYPCSPTGSPTSAHHSMQNAKSKQQVGTASINSVFQKPQTHTFEWKTRPVSNESDSASLLSKVRAARAELSRNNSQRSIFNTNNQSRIRYGESGFQPGNPAEEQTRVGSGEIDGYFSATSERMFKLDHGSRGFNASACLDEHEVSLPLEKWKQTQEQRRASISNTDRVYSRNASARSILRAELQNSAHPNSKDISPSASSGLFHQTSRFQSRLDQL